LILCPWRQQGAQPLGGGWRRTTAGFAVDHRADHVRAAAVEAQPQRRGTCPPKPSVAGAAFVISGLKAARTPLLKSQDTRWQSLHRMKIRDVTDARHSPY